MGATDGRWRAPLIWQVLARLARLACALVGRLRVSGSVPDDLTGTPVILASNHIGLFDPVVLSAATATIGLAPRMLATAGLLRAPVVGPVLRACGHIPVDRRSLAATTALQDAEKALAQGCVLAVYPEGRIGLDPDMWPERGKTGLARLALRTGATVVPVAQWGAHEVLAYDGVPAMLSSFLLALWRRPTLRVRFGPPVDLSGLQPDQPGAAHRATERIMDAIAQALAEIRGDERHPRFVDPTRPPSTARSRVFPPRQQGQERGPEQA